jgi:L-asparaginase
MTRPVTILAAGGTIAMVGHQGGPASPELGGDALVAAVPMLAQVPGLQTRTVAVVPSAHLSCADAFRIARAAADLGEQGRGVVVTHGTDTLEEVAFLCDLLYAGDAPIVFTGAMRPASTPGADGPGNLADAVAVATSEVAAGLGTVVAFAGQIHAAHSVRKADSTHLAAFESPQTGPIGRVEEGRTTIDRLVVRRPAIPATQVDGWVEILAPGLGGDGRIIDAAVEAGVDGIVAVALGAGHLPPPAFRSLERARARVPVIATVRPKRGAILHDTYDFEGSERDLRGSGFVPAGGLSSAAARMKLLACLGAGYDRDQIAAAFAPDDL